MTIELNDRQQLRFTDQLLCAGNNSNPFIVLVHVLLITILKNKNKYYLHFPGVETGIIQRELAPGHMAN